MPHTHYAAITMTFPSCQHIPWHTLLSHASLIPSCPCDEDPIFNITYSICNCGRILGQTINHIFGSPVGQMIHQTTNDAPPLVHR